MKIEKSVFAKKLIKLKAAVPNKTTHESLQGILLKDNYLIAYNLEIAVKAKLDIETDESFIIPIKMIDLIIKLQDGIIEIKADNNNNLTLKCNGTKSRFMSFPPSDFPELPILENAEDPILIDGPLFTTTIKKVVYVVPDEDIKPVLTGMSFNASDGFLNLVSCDGHRIVWAKLEHDGNFKFIVPKIALQKLLSLNITKEIEILHNNRLAIFKSEDYILISRLISGEYINYKRIFPAEYQNCTKINRVKIVNAVERLLTSSMDKLKVLMKLEFKEDKLRISSKSTISEYVETIELDESVEEQTINMNARYIYDNFKALDSEKISVKFKGEHDPIIYENEDETITGLILGVRA